VAIVLGSSRMILSTKAVTWIDSRVIKILRI
jgi:hypothetical protein